MFDLNDIRRVQRQRPDLDNNEASEVLGFLNDTYSIESYDIHADKLFKDTADYMFPEVKEC